MSDKPEMTHVDLFLSTADALGLSPRARREGLDVLREAADRLDGNTDQSVRDDGHDGWCGCERCQHNQSDGDS